MWPRGASDVRDEELAHPQSRRVDAPGGAEEESETTGVAHL